MFRERLIEDDLLAIMGEALARAGMRGKLAAQLIGERPAGEFGEKAPCELCEALIRGHLAERRAKVGRRRFEEGRQSRLHLGAERGHIGEPRYLAEIGRGWCAIEIPGESRE